MKHNRIESPLSFLAPIVLAAGLAAISTAAHADDDTSQGKVERCSQVLGTMAVAEPQSQAMSDLNRYGLGSPSAMLRMMAMSSVA